MLSGAEGEVLDSTFRLCCLANFYVFSPGTKGISPFLNACS